MPAQSLQSPLAAGSPLLRVEAELSRFELATEPRGCLVTLRNATTDEREALIVAAGVHFWYYAMPELGFGAVESGDYLAGPVHVEVPAGTTVPFRFSDPRRPVYKVAVGVRVMFGNAFGFPAAHYENYFWEEVLPPSPPVQPPPLHPRIGEIHLDFRLKRSVPLATPPLNPVPVGTTPATLPGTPAPAPTLLPDWLKTAAAAWPPIPGPGALPAGTTHWFELAERPR